MGAKKDAVRLSPNTSHGSSGFRGGRRLRRRLLLRGRYLCLQVDGAGGGAIISKKKMTSTADPAEPTVNTSAMQVLSVHPKTHPNECNPLTSQRMTEKDNDFDCLLSEIYTPYILFLDD